MRQGRCKSLRKLVGVTLMEAILVSAIMGVLMAYIGDIILKQSKENVFKTSAVKVIVLQKALRKYASDIQWNLSPDASTGSKFMINPFLTADLPASGKVWINFEDLEKKLKNANCGAGNEIPADVIDRYLECSFKSDIYPVNALGAFVHFQAYKNISYPTVKRKISQFEVLYDISNKPLYADFFRLIETVTNQVLEDGYNISADDLELTLANYTAPPSTDTDTDSGSGSGSDSGAGDAGTATRGGTSSFDEMIDPANIISYSAFMAKTPKEITEYIETVNTNSSKQFAFITKDSIDLTEYIKSDGSVTMNKGKALCWDSNFNASVPCIRVVPDSVIPDKEFFVTNTDMVFGGDKLKTAPKISYHVFKDGKNVLLPYMECLTEAGGVTLENKLVAIPSSFSSASESGTNFSNPEQIISKGTKGAGGTHSMMSGLSLQWQGIEADMQWSISGAVGIDGAFRSQNNSSSVLRNPNSISFIAIQWCEEA